MTSDIRCFVLDALNQALATWCEITGLDTSSPEWGEVAAVLDDCGLLDADRLPQHSLFDAEDAPPPPEHIAAVLRTRTALIGGARIAQQREDVDLSYATGVEVMAVLLDQLYRTLEPWQFTGGEEVLGSEAAQRLLCVARSPSDALGFLLVTRCLTYDIDEQPPLIALLLRVALDNDDLARDVFARIPELGREYQVGLAPLCDGRWIIYDTNKEN